MSGRLRFLSACAQIFRPTDRAGSLSIAQQQIVAIAQALSINAKLVIMDEPTSALSKQETERLFEIVRQLKAQGITIVYVSHSWRKSSKSPIGSQCFATAATSEQCASRRPRPSKS